MATLDEAFFKRYAPNAKPEIIKGIVASLEHIHNSGIAEPLILAHFLSQLMHESGGFRHVVEIWGKNGGTAAQKRYDTRTDLGNTAAVDGDGYLYRGRGLIQLTGKSNYKRFTAWAKTHFPKCPDFVKTPDNVAHFPWAILAGVWYWQVNNLTARAQVPVPEAIISVTKGINGGTNGLADRVAQFDRIALLMLDYDTDEAGVRKFQTDFQLVVDGDLGPKTRGALMRALRDIRSSVEIRKTAVAAQNQSSTRPAWTPKKSDVLGNIISYIFWAATTLLKHKLFGGPK